MAQRYCDGRQTAAVSLFNEITRRLLDAGVELDSFPLYARDGMGRGYDELTEEQAGKEPTYRELECQLREIQELYKGKDLTNL